MHRHFFYKNHKDRRFFIRLIRDVLDGVEKVVFACLYGSFVEEGDFFYDIDIAVFLKDGNNSHSMSVDIKEKIAERFVSEGVDRFAADDFDVRVINDAPYDFVIDILNKGIVVVDKDEEVRTSFIEHISMEYRVNQIVLDEALR